MIFINEWLPNPAGDDAKGEFVELFNSGKVPVNLGGWVLKNESGKDFVLKGVMEPQGYLVLPRSKTKLTLKNSDGALFLYDAAGKLVDHSIFVGAAPNGESFNRTNYDDDEAHELAQNFVWSAPTPGSANHAVLDNAISANHYPIGVPLGIASLSILTATLMALALGMALAGIMIYSLKQDEDLSQLFFGKNDGVGGGGG